MGTIDLNEFREKNDLPEVKPYHKKLDLQDKIDRLKEKLKSEIDTRKTLEGTFASEMCSLRDEIEQLKETRLRQLQTTNSDAIAVRSVSKRAWSNYYGLKLSDNPKVMTIDLDDPVLPFPLERVLEFFGSIDETFGNLKMGIYASNPGVKDHELYSKFLSVYKTTGHSEDNITRALLLFDMILELEEYEFVTYPWDMLSKGQASNPFPYNATYTVDLNKKRSRYHHVIEVSERDFGLDMQEAKVIKSWNYKKDVWSTYVGSHTFEWGVFVDEPGLPSNGRIIDRHATLHLFKLE
jgi:hypothetical protein